MLFTSKQVWLKDIFLIDFEGYFPYNSLEVIALEKNELFLEVFREVLSKQDIRVEFPSLIGVDVNKLMESIYYRALNRIKGYIRDDSLSDPECFQQIELVISTLEHLGSSGGFRHDF